jgi:T5SS/PEP-CTERM-associated repeat protein
MRRPSVIRLLVTGATVALSVAAFPASVQAQTNSWVNAGSGAWEDSTNWSLAQAPAITHSILITNDNTKTVQINSVTSGSFSNTMTVTNVIVSAPNGATNILALSDAGTNRPLHVLNNLSITAEGLLLMTNSSLLVDGFAGGAFSLDGSASLSGTNGISGDLYVGFSTNSSGSVNLVDGQTLLTNGYTVIGFYGSVRVVLANGTLKVADILASTNDTLANGVFLGLTSGSAGDLTIAGGKYDALELLTLGDESVSTGSVWVSDGQLIIGTNDYLMTIGNNGVGQLILSNGQLAASYVIVASGPASHGTLMIAGGAGSFSRALSVGVGQGATGTVFITGGQLEVTNHNVIVGDYGVGQMTVSNGAFLARTVVVGHNNGSQGTLTISGGIILVASNLVAGAYSNATGVIQVTGGELDITNQSGTGQLVVGQIGSGAFAQGGGTLIVDQLLATNGANSIFNFGSGTFNTKSTTVSNTQTFVVGDGFGSATYHLLGGVHSFANDLRIRTNTFLIGCGTINGNVVVDAGGHSTCRLWRHPHIYRGNYQQRGRECC